jgi:hypothetical protein
LALPANGVAQTSLWLDAAYSTARPPAGAPQSDAANYGIIGLRGETVLQPITLNANISGGHALESGAGRWLWVQSEAQHEFGKIGAFLLQYRESFDYGTIGAQLQPRFRFAKDALTLRPLAVLSRWSADSVAETYGVLGAQLQYERTAGSILLRVTGDAYTSGNNGFASGGYFTLGADAYAVVRATTVGAGVSLASNPLDTETGFTLWASRALNENLRFDALFSHTVTDAVFGTPGSLGFTALLSWRFRHKLPPAPPQLASVGEPVSRGRVVQFSVKIPKPAKTVAVSGTFTDWRPVALRNTGQDTWTGNVTVAPGTHQYGFLIDGREWYVPLDAADVIDDGFGRKNVTLVVRP